MINGMRRRSNIKTPRPAEHLFRPTFSSRVVLLTPAKVEHGTWAPRTPLQLMETFRGQFLRSSPVFPMFTL